MMTGKSGYDSEVQMFIDEPRKLSLDRLRFLRWLAERGLLEHEVAGVPDREHQRRDVNACVEQEDSDVDRSSR
jgi:hypothetical protein